MTVQNQHRFNSKQYDRYSINDPGDLAEFQALFASVAPPGVVKRQEGDIILDSYTGTAAMLWFDNAAETPQFEWTGMNGTIMRNYFSDAAIPANRFVKFNSQKASLCGSGEAAFGITLNHTFDDHELQYVLKKGTYLVELSQPNSPPTLGEFAASDANGKLFGVGEFSGFWNMGWITNPDVLIGALHYGVVEYRIPIFRPGIE